MGIRLLLMCGTRCLTLDNQWGGTRRSSLESARGVADAARASREVRVLRETAEWLVEPLEISARDRALLRCILNISHILSRFAGGARITARDPIIRVKREP